MRVRSKSVAVLAAAALVLAAPLAAHADELLPEGPVVGTAEPEVASEPTPVDPIPEPEPEPEPTPVDPEPTDPPVGPTPVDPAPEPEALGDVPSISLTYVFEDYCGYPTGVSSTDGDTPWQRSGEIRYDINGERVLTVPFTGGVADVDLTTFAAVYKRDGVATNFKVSGVTFPDLLESSWTGIIQCWADVHGGHVFLPEQNIVELYFEGDYYVEDSDGNIYTERTDVVLTEETTFTLYPSIEGEVLHPDWGDATWTYSPTDVEPEPEPIVVTPLPPTQVGNVVTIPEEQEGVRYYLHPASYEGPVVVESGPITITEDVAVHASPFPWDEYIFPEDAVTDWNFAYTPVDGEFIVVTPQPPTQDGNVVTIPDQDGVDYVDENGTILPPGPITIDDDFTVIAVPSDPDTIRFPDDAETEWTFEFTPVKPGEPGPGPGLPGPGGPGQPGEPGNPGGSGDGNGGLGPIGVGVGGGGSGGGSQDGSHGSGTDGAELATLPRTGSTLTAGLVAVALLALTTGVAARLRGRTAGSRV